MFMKWDNFWSYLNLFSINMASQNLGLATEADARLY